MLALASPLVLASAVVLAHVSPLVLASSLFSI